MRRFKVKPLLGSGLENRFWGEIGIAMSRVSRDLAGHIAEKMLQKYEHRITRDSNGGPVGYTFDEIYDMKTLQPKQRFLDVYDKVKKDLENLGLEI
jgi:hypothetical protein